VDRIGNPPYYSAATLKHNNEIRLSLPQLATLKKAVQYLRKMWAGMF